MVISFINYMSNYRSAITIYGEIVWFIAIPTLNLYCIYLHVCAKIPTIRFSTVQPGRGTVETSTSPMPPHTVYFFQKNYEQPFFHYYGWVSYLIIMILDTSIL